MRATDGTALRRLERVLSTAVLLLAVAAVTLSVTALIETRSRAFAYSAALWAAIAYVALRIRAASLRAVRKSRRADLPTD